MFRLSTNSSNINIFTQNKHKFKAVLKSSGYTAKIFYKPWDETVDVGNRNNRARKILWFTPAYNMAGANKIGKEFF